MRILNVLLIKNSMPEIVGSFPIYEEQLSDEIIEKAEELFIQTINQIVYPYVLSIEEEEYFIENGSYFNEDNDINVFLIWGYTD